MEIGLLDKARVQSIMENASCKFAISPESVRVLMADITYCCRTLLIEAGYPPRKITALTTKFRDAGRRSPPWMPTSSKVPGRPQDGADGNRRCRWLFQENHKFYASEVSATLVEVKYYLQTLSMTGAPSLPEGCFQDDFRWLVEHRVEPGLYLDPIQLIPISFETFIEDPRTVQSGHFTPLDRGGRHVPSNAFLMLKSSNDLQGNMTLGELIDLMEEIVRLQRGK